MADGKPPSTSPTLLHLLGCPGHEDAWRTFLELYGPFIGGRARRAGLQSADVDEVTSRVLASLLSAMPGFRYDPARKFRGYLTTVADNAVKRWWLEHHRRPGTQGKGGDDDHALLNGVPLPDSLASLGGELDDQIRRRAAWAGRLMELVRGQVEPETWEAFRLTALDGVPAAEAAGRLGKSVGAVYMARSRVVKLLKQTAADHADGRDGAP
jgi:RNA polymerase sigma factor (sigma-70 family)